MDSVIELFPSIKSNLAAAVVVVETNNTGPFESFRIVYMVYLDAMNFHLV